MHKLSTTLAGVTGLILTIVIFALIFLALLSVISLPIIVVLKLLGAI